MACVWLKDIKYIQEEQTILITKDLEICCTGWTKLHVLVIQLSNKIRKSDNLTSVSFSEKRVMVLSDFFYPFLFLSYRRKLKE